MRVYLVDGTCHTPVFLAVCTANLTKTIPVLRNNGTISFYRFKCALRLVSNSGCTAYVVVSKKVAVRIVRSMFKHRYIDLRKYADVTFCFPDEEDIPRLEDMQKL